MDLLYIFMIMDSDPNFYLALSPPLLMYLARLKTLVQNFIRHYPTPAYNLEVKVTDEQIFVKNFASNILRSLNF